MVRKSRQSSADQSNAHRKSCRSKDSSSKNGSNGSNINDKDNNTNNFLPRVREACTRCRLKKRKCDGRRPCTACQDSDAVCRYSQSKPSLYGRNFSGTYVEMLDMQLELVVPAIRELHKRLCVFDRTMRLNRPDGNEPTVHDIVAALGLLHGEEQRRPTYHWHQQLCETCQERSIYEPASLPQSEISTPSTADRLSSQESLNNDWYSDKLTDILPPAPPELTMAAQSKESTLYSRSGPPHLGDSFPFPGSDVQSPAKDLMTPNSIPTPIDNTTAFIPDSQTLGIRPILHTNNQPAARPIFPSGTMSYAPESAAFGSVDPKSPVLGVSSMRSVQDMLFENLQPRHEYSEGGLFVWKTAIQTSDGQEMYGGSYS